MLTLRLTKSPFSAGAARRAAAIILAVLTGLQALPAPAQGALRRLPTRLLPGPGNAGISVHLFGREAGYTVASAQHPLFESSFTGDPNEIVARSKYGTVSSRDLYLWMLLRESPNHAFMLETLSKAKLPEERKVLTKALKAEIDEFIFTNHIIPRLQSAAPEGLTNDQKHRIYTLPAYQTVFLQRIVEPRLVIEPADRIKYLQEHGHEIAKGQRWRTRYIFRASDESDSPDIQDSIEVDLDTLRTQVLSGEVSFADAARQHSEAASASRGGEIPPFAEEELFFLYEDAASSLKPGEVSNVFRGPGGFYLVQLIEVLPPEEPSLDNAAHARLVNEGLTRQVLKGGYEIYMLKMLEEHRRIVDDSLFWDDLEECEAVGHVCDFAISKGQIRNLYPDIEDNTLRLRTDLLAPRLRTMLEREAMAQEVCALGFDNDPILERARQLAGNMVRRDAYIERVRGTLNPTEQIVRAFWEKNPKLFTPLALKRVIKLALVASNTAPLPAQTRLELDRVLAEATGTVPETTIAKRKIQDEERSNIMRDTMRNTQQAYEMMGFVEPFPETFSETARSTDSEEMLPDVDTYVSDPDSTMPVMMPGLERLPGPDSVSTDSLNSLQPSLNSLQPSLSNDETTGAGGAAPTPAAGGGNAADSASGDILPSLDAGAPLNVSTSETTASSEILPSVSDDSAADKVYKETSGQRVRPNWNYAKALPAQTPRAGAIPVGPVAPAIGPGLTLEPTPNVRKQLPPPATSAIPYNPDYFYARMDAARVQELVGAYASTDWILNFADLGFIYIPDHPGIPEKTERVPLNAFSRPILENGMAVSYYIEDMRMVEKPSFEQSKTHAYEVWTQVQVDKKFADTYNSELKDANVQYLFK